MADAFLFVLWLGAAAALYVLFVRAVQARRTRALHPPADLHPASDDSDEP